MTPAALALAKTLELITLAIEASAAANRISALIAARQAAGKEITEDDFAALMADRQIAQAALAASIIKRQDAGG